jgi:hypothetical protein
MTETFSKKGFVLFTEDEKKDFLDALKDYFPDDARKLSSFDIMINKDTREYLLLRKGKIIYRMTISKQNILYQLQ